MVMEISFFKAMVITSIHIKAMVITSIHINLRNFLYVIGIAATESAGKRADQSASAEKVRAQGTHEADDGPDQAANSRTAGCRRAEDGADAAPDTGSHGSRYGRCPSCTNDRITEI